MKLSTYTVHLLAIQKVTNTSDELRLTTRTFQQMKKPNHIYTLEGEKTARVVIKDVKATRATGAETTRMT